MNRFASSGYNSLGIVCKTQKQAEEVYQRLSEASNQVRLLDESSTTYINGLLVTTAHLAKGLEFDKVIVPFCTRKNYSTEPDRQMLYVACTRAMHELDVLCSNNLTVFL